MDIEKLKTEFEQTECFKRLEHVAQYTFFEFGAYIKRTDVPADIEKKCGKLITALLFSWSAWKEAKAQSDQKIKLLLCDEHLKKCESPTGVFNSQYPDEEPCLICLAKETKAQAVPEGFVLVSAEQLSQWGYMANCAEEYGCPECFEARGYAHSLACEINEFFAIEAQESAND